MARKAERGTIENVGTADHYSFSGTAEEIKNFIYERSQQIDPLADPALTRVELDISTYYDSTDIDVIIKTTRPETDEEFAKRLEANKKAAAKNRAARAKAKAELEARELAQLAALKAKYEQPA
jgi:predicted ATPase with chaperone activity